MSGSTWQRVTRAKPCPVCAKHDWCLVAADGSAAICPRVESSQRAGEAGWLHPLRDTPRRRLVRSLSLVTAAVSGNDLARLAACYQEAVDPGRLYQFARSLALSTDSLTALGIGWSEEHRAWSFPMRNVGGDVLGIRLRHSDGCKFAVKGSKEGLFLPPLALPDSPLLVCEGPTDTAALLDLGFGAVVGRPSCTGGVRLLVELVRQRHPATVVIVADADEPGRRGADNLASLLVAYTPVVRVIQPPQDLKDVRDWLRAGGTRADVEQIIAATPVRRLGIRIVKKGG